MRARCKNKYRGREVRAEVTRQSNMKKKVSIITVVYNNANTIEQTIKSVLNQTYHNIEYIIIDGASTDGTVEIIRKYLDRIAFFISEKDEGLYYAMNKGIKMASGEIIGLLNSDDVYAENTISLVVDFFESHQVDILYGNALMVDDTSYTSMYDCSNLNELWYRMAIPHPATFVKKDVYIEHGMFATQYKIAADYDLMLRFYSEGAIFGHIEDILTYFRKGGLSSQRELECLEEAQSIALKYIHRCKKRDEYLSKIERYYTNRKFELACKENDELILSGINEMIPQKTDCKIAVFGIGMWGELCFQILSNNRFFIDFFVDNDSQKWEEKFHGIDVKSPDYLFQYEGYVLIATFVFEEAIRTQLMDLDNRLKIISLSEWAGKCFNNDTSYIITTGE